MNLTNLSDVVETQEFKINGEWHMRGTKVEWDEVVLPQHPDIRYSKVSNDYYQKESGVQFSRCASPPFHMLLRTLLFTDNNNYNQALSEYKHSLTFRVRAVLS